jgi:hypothetical protein
MQRLSRAANLSSNQIQVRQELSSDTAQMQNAAAFEAQISQPTYFFLPAIAGRGFTEGTTAKRQLILPNL